MTHNNVTPIMVVSFTLIFSQDLESILPQEGESSTTPPTILTFHTPSIMNLPTTETMREGTLQFSVYHRFAPLSEGFYGFFGLDRATDISISLGYGIARIFSAEAIVAKGTGVQRPIMCLRLALRLLTQSSKIPLSITFNQWTLVAVGKESSDPTSEAYYQSRLGRRLAYINTITLARKFSARISAGITGAFIHRNFVRYGDYNQTFMVGGIIQVGVSPWIGLFVEYIYLPEKFKQNTTYNIKYVDSFSAGIFWLTGGHVFYMGLSNCEGLLLHQVATNTSPLSSLRLTFAIYRTFAFKNLSRPKESHAT